MRSAWPPYTMDSHNCQRVVQGGVVRNEGNVEVRPTGPYAIPYRALTPATGRVRKPAGQRVPPAEHRVRLDPHGAGVHGARQSAAIAAGLALEHGTSVQAVDADDLARALIDAGQVLEYVPNGEPIGTGNPAWEF